MSQITLNTNNHEPFMIIEARDATEEISVYLDSDELTQERNHVPCSKFVYDISSQLSTDLPKLSRVLSAVEDLELSTQAIAEIADGCVLSIQAHDTTISTMLKIVKPLEGCNPVSFCGVTTTDPNTGIVTIDGVLHAVSSDFVNGNIVYYHKTFDGVAKLYAYVYANGVFNIGDVGSEDGGKFKQIGYGFYDNLSTNIHDDMVDDNAAIKMYKIDGLSAFFDKTSTDIYDLSCRLSADELTYDNNILVLSSAVKIIAENYVDLSNFNNSVNYLSDRFKDYVLTADVAVTSSDYIATEINANTTERSKKVASLALLDEVLDCYASKLHEHCILNIIDYLQDREKLIMELQDFMGAWYLLKSQVCLGYDINAIDWSDVELNKNRVPNVDMLKKLVLTSTGTGIEVGTVRFVSTIDGEAIDYDTDVASPKFSGWTKADGRNIIPRDATRHFLRAMCNGDYSKLKPKFTKYKADNDDVIGFTLPKIESSGITYGTNSTDYKTVALVYIGDGIGTATEVKKTFYTVNFYGNNYGKCSYVSALIEENANLGSFPDVEVTDLSNQLTSWNTLADGKGDTYYENSVITSNVNLYALYGIAKYKIILDKECTDSSLSSCLSDVFLSAYASDGKTKLNLNDPYSYGTKFKVATGFNKNSKASKIEFKGWSNGVATMQSGVLQLVPNDVVKDESGKNSKVMRLTAVYLKNITHNISVSFSVRMKTNWFTAVAGTTVTAWKFLVTFKDGSLLHYIDGTNRYFNGGWGPFGWTTSTQHVCCTIPYLSETVKTIDNVRVGVYNESASFGIWKNQLVIGNVTYSLG